MEKSEMTGPGIQTGITEPEEGPRDVCEEPLAANLLCKTIQSCAYKPRPFHVFLALEKCVSRIKRSRDTRAVQLV